MTPRSSTFVDSPADTHDEEWLTPETLPLFRAFVEEIVRRGLEARRDGAPDGSVPDLDWEVLWESGRGARSLEEAIGRVAMAADVAARADVRVASPLSEPLPVPATEPEPVIDPVSEPEMELTAIDAVEIKPGWSEALIDRVVYAVITPDAAPMPDAAPTPAHQEPVVESGARTMPVGVAPTHLIAVPELVVVADPEPPAGARRLARQRKVVSRRTRVTYVAFGWVRNVGAIVLLFAAWQVWGTSISQHHAQESLRVQFKSEIASHPVPPANTPVALIPASAQVAMPGEGSVVAELKIPTIGVDQLVVQGTAEGDLSKGPGHYIGSAAPGQAGNVAIAGHRTTYGAPFYNLSSLAIGDAIYLTTGSDERLTYVVAQAPFVVAPNDVAILNSSGDNRLTLTTCNPRYSSTSRLVVVAELHQNVAPTVAPTPRTLPSRAKVPHKTRITTGFVGWRWSYLPGVLLMLGVLAALGLACRKVLRHFGPVGGWVILVPLWAAGLYILFGLLTSLLPAAI